MNRRIVGLALVLALSSAGAGCAAEPARTAAVTSAPSERIAVGLTEWAVVVAAPALPGDVLLVVTNTGAATHDLVVTGDLGEWATPHLAPGERYELAVQAQAGETLRLDCTLIGHHEQGMWTTLRVTL